MVTVEHGVSQAQREISGRFDIYEIASRLGGEGVLQASGGPSVGGSAACECGGQAEPRPDHGPPEANSSSGDEWDTEAGRGGGALGL